ncbi:hypothetical protein [Thermococcus thioreducens]|uniref:Uncharacterized protein n=1 Tax=Thermococcus thioreducens TaxID=277988 RepID=A0A1I0Q8Y4_9EURY|nr:hypothetical protein [Thermococcus thioreducens]SEW23249.1 hypothetical protein SAMN05216170_2295 [Thermococcus thioreducens]
MFGLEFLNLSPEMAFGVGVLFGLLLAWGIYEDLVADRRGVHG